MSQVDFAKDYLREANLRLKTADHALSDKAHAYCVRQCQEAIELGLKAALRLIGIDYPKWHDVGIVLVRAKERFPPWFQLLIPQMESISKLLAAQRESAMYGIEMHKRFPSSLFTEQNAQESIRDAKFCVENVEKLLETILNPDEIEPVRSPE